MILQPVSRTIFIKSAASAVRVSNSSSLFIVIGILGNFLMVTTAPPSAIGGSTTFTLEPSESLASTIGSASFTVRLTLATICWIMSSSSSSEPILPSNF